MSNAGLVGRAFLKMNGLGNDFVILDLRDSDLRPTAENARAICDREAGIGCDQLITIEQARSKTAAAFMGVYNPDGSVSEACGNAARCVGRLLMDETNENNAAIDTLGGAIRASNAGDNVSVDMGRPRFDWRDIPLSEPFEDTRFLDIKLGPIDAPVLWGPSAVNMGNPHCVFFVDNVDAHDLTRFGPMIENHPLFPERANVSIAEVKSKNEIRLRVWERGAGLTQACGSAACAALAAAVRRRLTDRAADVRLDGGALHIDWRPDDHIIRTGPIETECEGSLSADLLEAS